VGGNEGDAPGISCFTGGPSTGTPPSVAATSGMLCATVNAAMVATMRLPPRTISSSASTNRQVVDAAKDVLDAEHQV